MGKRASISTFSLAKSPSTRGLPSTRQLSLAVRYPSESIEKDPFLVKLIMES